MAVLLSVERALPSAGEASSTLSVAVPSGTTKLVVFASNCLFNPRTVSGIAFNTSENFTAVSGGSVTDTTPYIRTEAWFLDNPTITTANVVVTWSGSARGAVTVLCLDDTAAGQPSAVNTGQITGSVAASTVAVSSPASGIVLSGYAVRRGDATTAALTAGTSIENFIGSAGSGDTSTRMGVASQSATGASVSTTWTPSGTGDRAAHVVLSIASAVSGPTISVQPTAQTKVLTNANTATFSCTATGTGTVDIVAEIETAPSSGTFETLANGSGATWTGLTASGSGSASISTTGTFTAKTLTGRTVRLKCDDSNGTTYSDAVLLTLFDGPQVTAFGPTDGSGVSTATLTCDYVTGVGEAIEVAIVLPDGRVAVTTTTTA